LVERPILNIAGLDFDPRLIIFDKDGTLIDFHVMWGGWVVSLGRRLDFTSGVRISPRLYHSFGFDEASFHVAPDGPLAVSSMAALRSLTVDLIIGAGLERGAAERAVSDGWFAPDPVRLARPLADLPRIFDSLSANGIKTAVATSDDRTATEATLNELGIASFVDAITCADDGLPPKPAADMVQDLCRRLGLRPAQAVMVGDGAADLLMGRAAGAGLVVGVLSGVSSAESLAPLADVVIPSVGELVAAAES
jgi:phosphoglycolate phosphatase